jgi:hypothetical protein
MSTAALGTTTFFLVGDQATFTGIISTAALGTAAFFLVGGQASTTALTSTAALGATTTLCHLVGGQASTTALISTAALAGLLKRRRVANTLRGGVWMRRRPGCATVIGGARW